MIQFLTVTKIAFGSKAHGLYPPPDTQPVHPVHPGKRDRPAGRYPDGAVEERPAAGGRAVRFAPGGAGDDLRPDAPRAVAAAAHGSAGLCAGRFPGRAVWLGQRAGAAVVDRPVRARFAGARGARPGGSGDRLGRGGRPSLAGRLRRRPERGRGKEEWAACAENDFRL